MNETNVTTAELKHLRDCETTLFNLVRDWDHHKHQPRSPSGFAASMDTICGKFPHWITNVIPAGPPNPAGRVGEGQHSSPHLQELVNQAQHNPGQIAAEQRAIAAEEKVADMNAQQGAVTRMVQDQQKQFQEQLQAQSKAQVEQANVNNQILGALQSFNDRLGVIEGSPPPAAEEPEVAPTTEGEPGPATED